MALGKTSYVWRPDVREIVLRINSAFPGVHVNTYDGHPWHGGNDINGWDWQHVSLDCWGPNGRGWPIPLDVGWSLRRFLMAMPGAPFIRHTIYQHQLWTSFGGISLWTPNDHSKKLRHLHVTYWL